MKISNKDYNSALSLITDKKHLQDLGYKSIAGSLPNNNLSLFELINKNEHDLVRLKSIGESRISTIEILKRDIEEDKEKYYLYYLKEIKKEIVLPLNNDFDLTIDKILINIIYDLILVLSKNNKKADKERVSILKEYYLENYNKSYADIAKSYNKTTERIRQIISDELSLKPKALLKLKQKFSIVILPELLEIISEFKDKYHYSSRFKKLENENILTITDSYFIRVDELYYILPYNEIKMFRNLHNKLHQNLCRDIVSLNKVEILKKLNPYNDQAFNKLLEEHPKLEKIEDGTYRVKWEFLAGQNDKIKRILFEKQSTLSKIEILEEYNRRAQKASIDIVENEDDLLIKSDGYLHSPQDRYWSYSTTIVKPQINGRTFIYEYIEKNGKVTFEEVKKKIENQGYLKYHDRTIRNYIQEKCLISQEDNNLFVSENKRDEFPNIKLIERRQKHLTNSIVKLLIVFLKDHYKENYTPNNLFDILQKVLLEEEIVISKRNFLQIIKKLVNDDNPLFFYKNEGGKEYLKIDTDLLKDIDLNKIGKEKEPTYRSVIRSYVINYLKKEEGFKATRNSLWLKFRKYIPEDIKDNVFYKIIRDKDFFEQIGTGAGSSIKLIANLLPEPTTIKEDVQEPIVEDQILTHKSELELVNLYQRKQYNWEELKEVITKELGREYKLDRRTISIGIDSFYNTISEGKETWSKSLLQTMYDFWFTKSDFYDRETFLFKLSFNYEPFLKRFNEKTDSYTGLNSVITSLPQIFDLKEYKKIRHNYIDKVTLNFSYIINSLSFYRNLYAHQSDDDKLDFGFSKQVKTITNFIALYIYSSYLLKR